MARFEIERDESSEYCWRFRTDNNGVVASGEGYRSRNDCEHSMQPVKDQVSQAEVAD